MRKNRKKVRTMTSKEVANNVFRSIKNNWGTFLVAIVCAFFMYIILSL